MAINCIYMNSADVLDDNVVVNRAHFRSNIHSLLFDPDVN